MEKEKPESQPIELTEKYYQFVPFETRSVFKKIKNLLL